MADSDIDNIHVLKIRESVPNRSHNEISVILQYYGNDVDTTVSAFQDGTAAEILKKMNVPVNGGKSAYKNKRKNKKKKKTSQADAKLIQRTDVVAVEEEDSVTEQRGRTLDRDSFVSPPIVSNITATISCNIVSSQNHLQNNSSNTTKTNQEERMSLNLNEKTKNAYVTSSPNSVQPVSHLEVAQRKAAIDETHDSSKTSTHSKIAENLSNTHTKNRNKSSSFSQSRATSITEEYSRPGSQLAGSSSHLGQGTKILEKSLKDLSRQTVALTRLSNLLEDELENSSKRIKSAIAEAQRLLLERQTSLEFEMERVKQESRQLLKQRKETAADLKQRADRASTLTESELIELRADIKQFVVDRKLDDELGKTHRFIYDKDRITEEITKFGEIHHVKNNYSQRRQSVSSVGSSTCQATCSKEGPPSETPSTSNLAESRSDVAAVNLNSSTEQLSEPKPLHLPPFPARPRIFFNTGRISNTDYGGGSNSGIGSYPRGSNWSFAPRGKGASYQSEAATGKGRQGYGSYGKPYYNRYSNHSNPMPTEQPAGAEGSGPPQRPPNRRGGRNPRYNSYHSTRHNNNQINEGSNKDGQQQVNGASTENKATSMVNGYDH